MVLKNINRSSATLLKTLWVALLLICELKAFTQKLYQKKDPSLPYSFWVYEPEGYNQKKDWPMIIFLHGRSLSAYGSKGGRGNIYHYYVCTYPGSRCTRYPIDWTHDFIISILEKIKISVQLIKDKRKIFDTLITQESSLRIKSISNTEQELIKLRHQLTHLRDEFLKRNLNGDTYQELRTEVESNIYHTELNLRDIVDEQNPLKKFLFEDVPTLEHIVEFYKKGSGVMKRRILSCIFSEKIYFNEEKDATIIYTKPIEVILQIFNELQNCGNKKRGQLDLFFQVAPPSGLEPETL